MKPKRMHMVHNMVVNYGLYKKLDIVVTYNKEQAYKQTKMTKVYYLETHTMHSISNDSFPL